MSTEQILGVCQWLDRRGWVANHDGNVSMRLPGQRFLVTPTAFRKGDIGAADLLIIDIDGTVLSGRHRVFSEWKVHRAVYEERPEMSAVLHCHAPSACAFAVSHRTLPIAFMPEAIVSLGPSIAHVAVNALSDARLPKDVAVAARTANAALLLGHGPLTWGRDLTMAMARMELVEHLATISLRAMTLGGPIALQSHEIEALTEKHRRAGLAAPSLGL